MDVWPAVGAGKPVSLPAFDTFAAVVGFAPAGPVVVTVGGIFLYRGPGYTAADPIRR